jgi:hypothetical protein
MLLMIISAVIVIIVGLVIAPHAQRAGRSFRERHRSG